jgi:alpha-L-fucosidase 2
MMLGTNDSKIYQWNRRQYHNDYVEMVKNMKNLPSKPEVYLMVPPPLYQDGFIQMQ